MQYTFFLCIFDTTNNTNIQKMYATTTTPTISQHDFDRLLKKAECETGDDLETIGFTSQQSKFAISFHQTDGEQLQVDEFHKLIQGEWAECEPTEEQLKRMQKVIDDRHNEIINENRCEAIAEIDERRHMEHLEYHFGYGRQ